MFKNDYSDIAHINILNALIKYSNEQKIGYGLDVHTKNAERLIKEVFDVPSADIHLLTGGTQSTFTEVVDIKDMSIFVRFYESEDSKYLITFDEIKKVA